MKKLLTFLFTLLLAVSLASCGEKEPKVELVTINTALTTYKNKDAVKVEGVVYGTNNGGYYLYDGSESGYIFVYDTTNKPAIGEKIEITGSFSYNAKYPAINAVTEYKSVSTGNETLAPTTSTIPAIKALDSSSRTGSYSKLVAVVGSLALESAQYTLTDDDGNVITFNSESSNTEVLDANLNKRVQANIIVHRFVNNQWQVAFGGQASDIVAKDLSFDELYAMAQAQINEEVVTEVYGKILLPSSHPVQKSIEYTWSVAENPNIAIEANEATVTLDYENDHTVTLICEVAAAGQTRNIEVPVTLKAIKTQSVATLVATPPVVHGSVVSVAGTVVSFARNQGGSVFSVILQDLEAGDTIRVDFTDAEGCISYKGNEYKGLVLGDQIVVEGLYNDTNNCVYYLSKFEKTASATEYAHDVEDAIVLKTEADFKVVADNPHNYIGRLFKLENPYLQYSVSSASNLTTTNWVRIGASESIKALGDTKARTFSFLLICNDLTLGGTTWRDALDLPYTTEPAKQFGLTAYVYLFNVSDSYIQFACPDMESYVLPDHIQAKMYIDDNIETTLPIGTTSLQLPTEFNGISFAWTSDNAAITIGENGLCTVTGSEQTTAATLTATYTYEGTEYYHYVVVSIMGTEPVSVGQLVAEGTDGAVASVEGVVLGFASDGNSYEERKGVMLLDETTGDVLVVKNIGLVLGCTYPNYQDAAGNKIEIGTKISVIGQYSNAGQAVLVASEVTVGEKGEVAQITEGDKIVTVTNNDEFAALVSGEGVVYNKIIKVVATAENPIYFGGSSSTAPMNVKVYMNGGTMTDEIKYGPEGGTKLQFSCKVDVNTPNAEEGWQMNKLCLPNAFVSPNSSNPPRSFQGTYYFVINYTTSTYYQMSIVYYDLWEVYPEAKYVEESLVDSLTTSLSSGSTLDLPQTHPVLGTLTWESANSDLVNITTGTVGTVTENTPVVLTVKYNYLGKDGQVDVEFTVVAPVEEDKVFTVAELSSSTAELEDIKVSGIVLTYMTDVNKDKDQRYGIILIDSTTGNTIGVVGLAGSIANYQATDGATINIGDELKLSNVNFLTSTGTEYASQALDGREMLVVDADTVVEIKSTGNNVTINNPVEVSSEAELIAALSKVDYWQVFKLNTGAHTGNDDTLYLGNSSSSSWSNIYFNYRDNPTAGTGLSGAKYETALGNNITLACSSTLQGNWLGADWHTNLVGTTDYAASNHIGTTTTGYIYVVVSFVSSTYIQVNVVPGYTLSCAK